KEHMSPLKHFQFVIPKGTGGVKKMEPQFEEFLSTLSGEVVGKTISLEFLGHNQYVYLCLSADASISDYVESQLFAAFPNAEINAIQDYTESYDPKVQTLAGYSFELKFPDVFPLKEYDQFEEDSAAAIFSFLSK